VRFPGMLRPNRRSISRPGARRDIGVPPVAGNGYPHLGSSMSRGGLRVAGDSGVPAVRVRELCKVYGAGENRVIALDAVSLDFQPATFTAIMGPSGSGKSTLLHCAAGLDEVTSGSVFLGEIEITGLKEPRLTKLRRERIGFVFQSFNLVPSLNAWDNVLLPLRLAGKRPDPAWAREIIARVGLEERVRHRPAELSNGQQQRVALARAIVTRPQVIFADEPTGALDVNAGRQVMSLLRDAVDTLDQTVVMVTHDPRAAAYADRVLFLSDGSVVDDLSAPTPEHVAERMARLGD
jgi:putative ABC transport system ATP-binding protein